MKPVCWNWRTASCLELLLPHLCLLAKIEPFLAVFRRLCGRKNGPLLPNPCRFKNFSNHFMLFSHRYPTWNENKTHSPQLYGAV